MSGTVDPLRRGALAAFLLIVAMLSSDPMKMQAEALPSSTESGGAAPQGLADLRLPLEALKLRLSEDGVQARGSLEGAANALRRIKCRRCSLEKRREGVERFRASAAEWLEQIQSLSEQRGWEMLHLQPGALQWGGGPYQLVPPAGNWLVEVNVNWGAPKVFDDGEIELNEGAGQVSLSLAFPRRGRRTRHAFPVSLEGSIPEGYFREDGATGVLFRRERGWGPPYHQARPTRQRPSALKKNPAYRPPDHGYRQICTQGLDTGTTLWQRGSTYVEDRRRVSDVPPYDLRFFEASQDPEWLATHVVDPSTPTLVERGGIIYRGRLFPAPLRLTEDRQFIYHDGQPVFWKHAPRDGRWEPCPDGVGPTPVMATVIKALEDKRLLVFRGTAADERWLKSGGSMGDAALLSKVQGVLRGEQNPNAQMTRLRGLEWWPLRPSDGALREILFWSALPSDQAEPPIPDPLTRPEGGVLAGLTLYPVEAARVALSLGLPPILVSSDINALSRRLARAMRSPWFLPEPRVMDRYVESLNASLKALRQEGWEVDSDWDFDPDHSPATLSIRRIAEDRVVTISVSYPYADYHFGEHLGEEHEELGLYHYSHWESPRMASDLGLPPSPEAERTLERRGDAP